MDAGGAECAAAYSCRYFPALEVAEEFLPFLVAGNAVLIGGSLGSSPGRERQVRLDGLVWVDGLVAHRDVNVLVAYDNLRDVRRQPLMTASVMKIRRKSCGV